MNRSLEMEVFAAVVDAGSFVRAGEALNMSKAAVSRHVDALEKRLGVRLLQRTTRRLALTEEGSGFYHHCRDILAAMESAEAEVTSRVLEPSGTLRINVPVSFAQRHLDPLWGEFLRRYPKVGLDITLNDRVVDLIDEGFDMCVRIGNLSSSSLVSRRLASTSVLLVASPEYLRAHGTPSEPADLASHQVIAYSNWGGSGREEWAFTPVDGGEPVRVRLDSRVVSNSGDPCRHIALEGGGIVMQPDFLIGDDLRAGRLVTLLPQYAPRELGIHAVYPSRKQLPQKVRAMVNYLVECFAGASWGWSAEQAGQAPSGGARKAGRSTGKSL
ncbi:LysR family transcriptional regulator [Corticibacter populi]|uniref:LysR family transcriptional regulator n=1 Tax=Corticibacter populi TaxID=1550736 RepID=A0A3M6QXR2_9BURK|nr:LysR family transcriptional regulator [Corticibacter populi]RMX07774.1 LysR family transcriptional regulator [Corticibacter populi]RZS34997.1 DNA-binding transcriptional LysR family regulator [Corticibacter populi]